MSNNAETQALAELARRLDSLKLEEMKPFLNSFPEAISRLKLRVWYFLHSNSIKTIIVHPFNLISTYTI